MIAGNVRAILFDAVGTLIYPDPPVAEAYFRAGQKLGSKWTREEIAQRFRAAIKKHPQGSTTSEYLERERWEQIVYDVIDDVEDTERQLLDELWRHFDSAANWRLFDDVAPVWLELVRRDYVVGIASNFDSRLRTICRGLAPLVECPHIFVSSEIGFPKPEPRFYRAVEEQLELPAEQILLVGDDYDADIAGSRAAGWQTMWLRREEVESSPEWIHSLGGNRIIYRRDIKAPPSSS
jgi:putative hydrolase of the HAD superfamily